MEDDPGGAAYIFAIADAGSNTVYLATDTGGKIAASEVPDVAGGTLAVCRSSGLPIVEAYRVGADAYYIGALYVTGCVRMEGRHLGRVVRMARLALETHLPSTSVQRPTSCRIVRGLLIFTRHGDVLGDRVERPLPEHVVFALRR